MKKSSCFIDITNAEKRYPYDQYYFGEKDNEQRKDGKGENHWTGAESIEYYDGEFVRNTMHGFGDYRWRYKDYDGEFQTYEGYFFLNNIHGYGTMSYPDGRVFIGLYHKNIRWGPGLESYTNMREDVGLWRGNQLIRLAWRPPATSIVPDFTSIVNGRTVAELQRIILTTDIKIIGETNSALDLLKNAGCDPRWTSERWIKLYCNNCTDQASALCQLGVFQQKYYKGKIHGLQIVSEPPAPPVPEEKIDPENIDNVEETGTYFVWNNNPLVVNMMKHSYMHEKQRDSIDMYKLQLFPILSGLRDVFKPAGPHEVDCRTLLMASYLGLVSNVVQLVNGGNVHPDVSDSKGNTPIMYATCGDQTQIIHFLVEASANVNNYNDSCCTPLGIALMRYVCIQCDINPSGLLQALLPPPIPPIPPVPEQRVFEWNMTRDPSVAMPGTALFREPSKLKTNKLKNKSTQSLKDMPGTKRKTELQPKADIDRYESEVIVSEEDRICLQYVNKVSELFLLPNLVNPIPYVFEINDMNKEIDTADDDKKLPEKGSKKTNSKVLKETMKLSKEVIYNSSDKEIISIDSATKRKMDMLAQAMSTILQLLYDGADPKLVECPQPAVFMAVIANCPDLVRHLVEFGANVNETNQKLLGYTPLDVAISMPLTSNSLELIRTLLACGSNLNYRLPYDMNLDPPEPGPSLLHAVLAKKTENDMEDEIRRKILELLLDYKCDPLIQFRGRSAIDVAMMRNVDLIDVFINSPATDLNGIINDSNQSILVKMFSPPFFKTILQNERIQILTNLLLFGADPLIECHDDEETYQNAFVYAKNMLADMENPQTKALMSTKSVTANKAKQVEKSKKDEKTTTAKPQVTDVEDFKQALELMRDCARLLYIRWLQAKLMKDMIAVICRFSHRHWNMILKELSNRKSSGLWLNIQRCKEIWDILKTTNKKIYNDPRVLKHLLCIVQYYNKKYKLRCIRTVLPTTEEKNTIDSEINSFLRENKAVNDSTTVFMALKRPYVKPELAVKCDSKFDVCLECILPFIDEIIKCKSCKRVAFCSLECIQANVQRQNCHPCSDYLRMKYFPTPLNSFIINDVL